MSDKKRGPGRPKKDHKSRLITVRLNEFDDDKFSFLEQQTGLNKTEIFRKILDNGYEYFLDNGHF